MLLIDIGNTRIKAACLETDELRPLPAVATAAAEPFVTWAGSVPLRPTRLLAANVAGASVAAKLVLYARERWDREVEFVSPRRSCAGMTTHYAEPTRLGVDRWLAALAGFHRNHHAVCVIDVGTALTVDVVLADGSHLGGLIAPGPDLMRTSLTRGTAQLESDAIDPVDGFADNTRDAISLGCGDAIVGLLDRVAIRLARLTPPTAFDWIVTGGAAPTVVARLERAHTVVPDLVLQGLLVYAAAERA